MTRKSADWFKSESGIRNHCRGAIASSSSGLVDGLPFWSVDDEWRVVVAVSPNKYGGRWEAIPWFFVSNVRVDAFLREKELISTDFVRLMRFQVFRFCREYEPINFVSDAEEATRQFVEVVCDVGVPCAARSCNYSSVEEKMRKSSGLPGEALGWFGLQYLYGDIDRLRCELMDLAEYAKDSDFLGRSPGGLKRRVEAAIEFDRAIFSK